MNKNLTIAIINQKGGVAKTTTTAALAEGLSLKGYKVLAVDMDAQANLSQTMRADRVKVSVMDVLERRETAEQAIQHVSYCDVIPASDSLYGADLNLQTTGKEYRLRESLEPVKDRYDFIVIDTAPALGVLAVNALTAADLVIIPAQADAYSLQGIHQLAETIETVRKYCNHDLEIAGVLLTRYSGRAILSRDVRDKMSVIAESLGTKLFDTCIREAIAVKEAALCKQGLFEYAPKSNAAVDYQEFIDEFLRESKEDERL